MTKSWQYDWEDGVKANIKAHAEKFGFTTSFHIMTKPLAVNGHKVTSVMQVVLKVDDLFRNTGWCFCIDTKRNRILFFSLEALETEKHLIEIGDWSDVEYRPDKKSVYPDHCLRGKHSEWLRHNFHDLLLLQMDIVSAALRTMVARLCNDAFQLS